MKNYTLLIRLILGLVIVLLLVGGVFKISNLNKEIKTYDNNFKALNLELDKSKEDAMAYRFNAEQLEYLNDSIIIELNNIRKELKIKDKELKQLQNIKTEVYIKDSVFVRDTIFKDSFVKLDTVLTNTWYNTQVILEYPNKIKLNMMYRSDISVIASSKKEIIGTPKKCWLGRVFQKKHKVIRVDVRDANPYSEIKENKFIIIE